MGTYVCMCIELLQCSGGDVVCSSVLATGGLLHMFHCKSGLHWNFYQFHSCTCIHTYVCSVCTYSTEYVGIKICFYNIM